MSVCVCVRACVCVTACVLRAVRQREDNREERKRVQVRQAETQMFVTFGIPVEPDVHTMVYRSLGCAMMNGCGLASP